MPRPSGLCTVSSDLHNPSPSGKEKSKMSWNPYENLPLAASFSLTSSDLREGEKLAMPQVSGIFGAGGEDISPQLSWSGFPSGTKSFVVTMLDPEAPTVAGFWHWAVVNIPGDVTELPAGAGDESGQGLPPGAFQLPNDARTARYIGAGPPPGTGRHRYIFALCALDAERIEIDRAATPAWLWYTMWDITLGRAFLQGWYER
jgi:Raf kinase inhibitor-like YbhB/YbcL family protein